MGLSFLGFGASDNISDKSLYITVSFIMRLLQGLASCII
jgi:hypothetical protein